MDNQDDKPKLAAIDDHSYKPDLGVIKMAREILEKAESGELRAIVFTYQDKEELFVTGYDGCWVGKHLLIGVIDTMKFDLQVSMWQESGDIDD